MTWPAGYARTVLDSVDSTNAEALRRAPNWAGPEWIFTHQQTAGRGRRGRAWTDPAGNFAATLSLRPDMAAGQAALYSFVAAVALFDACVQATGRADSFALKWPNDVLLHGGKLAGILLESSGAAGGGVAHLAIGIGVNLARAPTPEGVEPGATPPVSLLSETGCAVAPQEFLDLLAAAFARYDAQFQSHGFDPIRSAWLTRAARLGQVITARTMRDTMTGTFETIDAQGNLVLQTASGRVAIPAADIFF